jgi:transposase
MARTKNEDERLDEAHFERVIKGLEQEKPITKKEACNILGIAYNTTRLGSLIEKYKENKKRDADRRAALRGKPATKDEIVYVIQEYLEGSTIDAISKSTYRSAHFVRNILDRFSVPIRASSHDYFRPELIPEGAIRDRFKIGEVVYSARYDSTARIETEAFSEKHGWFYRIWLLSDKWKQYAYQEATELASLEHLRAEGVRI